MLTLAGVLAFIGAVGVSTLFIQISGKNHGEYEPSHSSHKSEKPH